MKRLVVFLFALWFGCGPAHAGSMMLLGAGVVSGGAPAYTGPGDVKTSWKAWWGTRAFSNATLGSRLVNICNSTGGVDVNCEDALSNATTGKLVIPTSPVDLTPFCPGANCTVKTYYDQSGASACAGPCDFTQATIATRVILTANALGASTGTCGVASGAQTYSVGGFTSLPQPFTVSAVVKFASTSGSPQYLGSGGSGLGFGELSSAFAFYATSTVNGSASNTSPVALQNIAGGSGVTASFIVNNSTVGAGGNSGNASMSGTFNFAVDPFSNFMNGPICEVGVYPSAFNTTDASNMYGNQHTFWGF